MKSIIHFFTLYRSTFLLVWATAQQCKWEHVMWVAGPVKENAFIFQSECAHYDSLWIAFLPYFWASPANPADALTDVIKMMFAFRKSVISKFENCHFKEVWGFFPPLVCFWNKQPSPEDAPSWGKKIWNIDNGLWKWNLTKASDDFGYEYMLHEWYTRSW